MMVFIYYLLSLYIVTRYAHTQTTSETEAINKLIEELMSKSEKKNVEPIQFTWTNQFMVDPTPQSKIIEDSTEHHENEDDDLNLPTSLKFFEILTSTSDLGYSVKRDTQKELKEKEKEPDMLKAFTSNPTNLKILNEDRTTSQVDNTEDANQIVKTIQINEKITIKPVDHEAIYVTRAPGGEIRGHIFSGGLLDAVKVVTTKTSLHSDWKPYSHQSTFSATSRGTITPSSPSLENVPKPPYPASQDYKYHSDSDPSQSSIKDLNSTVAIKKLSVIKAIEDLINSIPNYNNDNEDKAKYEDILKGLFPDTKETEKAKVNSKHAIGSNLFQILGYHKNKLSADGVLKDMVTVASLRTMYTRRTTSTTSISSTPIPSTPISTTPATNPNPTSTEEIHEYGNYPSTEDLNHWYPDSKHNSDTTHSSSTTHPVSSTHSDLYLLVHGKNKALKGWISLRPEKGTSKAATQTTTVTERTTTTLRQELNKTHKKEDFAENKELLQLYSVINSLEKHKSKEKSKHKLNWDTIKKFLGHDRVCNCKCRENRTICKVCAATDRVMRELTFEFNNLANYMADHCLEIQTFFWMNPSGGKKLRDSVHKIDKSLHDYYKRVKGKCTGRTCKTFATYLDKRHLKLLKQAKVKYPWISTNIT